MEIGRTSCLSTRHSALLWASLPPPVARRDRCANSCAGSCDTAHPLLVQIIPIRRCNIDCGYCNEYDKVSPPVPTDVMMPAHRQARRTRHLRRRLQRRRADAAPGSRRPDPPHPPARHDGRAHHERLLPGAEADRGAEPAPASTSCRSASTTSSRTRCRRRACACSTRSCSTCSDHADVRRQHQLGARRRHQEPRGRADDQHAARARSASRPRSASSTTAGPAEAARRRRARGVRRCVGGDQRAVAGVQEPVLGDHELPGQPRGRQAERVAVPRRRALSLRLRGGPRPLLLAAARLRRACRSSRYTIDDIRREFATPKSCAPYCTVGCVHRVSTMDFWRSPQDTSAVGSRQSAVGSQRRSRPASARTSA